MKAACVGLGFLGVAAGCFNDDGGGGQGSSNTTVTTTIAASSAMSTGSDFVTSSGNSGISSASTGQAADVQVMLESAQFSVNCAPPAAQDPLEGTFSVNYKNNGAVASWAAITSAYVMFSTTNQSFGWKFDVTPFTVNLAPGEQRTETIQKVAGSGVAAGRPGSPCFHCAGTSELTVSINAGGTFKVQKLSLGATPCAF